MSSHYIETIDARRQAVAAALDEIGNDAVLRVVNAAITGFKVLCAWQQPAQDG